MSYIIIPSILNASTRAYKLVKSGTDNWNNRGSAPLLDQLKLEIDVTFSRELTPEQLQQAVTMLQEGANFLATEGYIPSGHNTPMQNWDSQVFELKTKRPWLASDYQAPK